MCLSWGYTYPLPPPPQVELAFETFVHLVSFLVVVVPLAPSLVLVRTQLSFHAVGGEYEARSMKVPAKAAHTVAWSGQIFRIPEVSAAG